VGSIKASVLRNIVNRIIAATRPLIESAIRSLYCAVHNRGVTHMLAVKKMINSATFLKT
jgi:hypothetical protein